MSCNLNKEDVIETYVGDTCKVVFELEEEGGCVNTNGKTYVVVLKDGTTVDCTTEFSSCYAVLPTPTAGRSECRLKETTNGISNTLKRFTLDIRP